MVLVEVPLRAPIELRELVQDYAEVHGTSEAAAWRELTRRGLQGEVARTEYGNSDEWFPLECSACGDELGSPEDALDHLVKCSSLS